MAQSSENGGRGTLAVVLAAGEGTRMRSIKPKVLHEVAGRSMLAHVLAALAAAGTAEAAVVVGPGRDDVAAHAETVAAGSATQLAAPLAVRVFVQEERRGTAHAVLAAEVALAASDAEASDLLVAFADTPLVGAETYGRLLAALRQSGAAVVVAGFEASDPTGYGRLLTAGDGELLAIREHKDATPAERAVTLCNGGLMALDGRHALALLRAVAPNNAQNEFYLTDVVALARARDLAAVVVRVAEAEVAGVNDRVQLAQAEAAMQARLRLAAMSGGATLVDPAGVTFSFDTALGRDVTVEPHVVFAPGVRVGAGSRIRAFSHLEGVTVGERAVVGPFARLRPGSVLGDEVHVGNFVEIKASTLERGVKANHLSYVGDSSVGAGSNLGAGTITCNYNGFEKFKTRIGANAFIGVNAALVAPVTIGDGAFIGTGSVVTQDVAADALLVARARGVEKPGWAKLFRERRGKPRRAATDGPRDGQS